MNSYSTSQNKPKVTNIIDLVRDKAHPLEDRNDLDPLLDQIGDSRYVLLGEASHGTHEYYTWRTRITQRLIEEKGFNFIAVEGDWPDCYKINRFVKHYQDSGSSSKEVLSNFERWPTWMWANWEVAALTEWLRDYNGDRARNKRVGFYGLDVYSLWQSMEEVLKYLEKNDYNAAEAARNALQCFEPYNDGEGQEYARATMRVVPETCEDEVVKLLQKVQQRMPNFDHDPEAALNTQQNAKVAVNAERYYRAMARGGGESWNVRDRHMHETLNRLMDFHGEDAKCIVWEHNTHIGDARATDMAREDMVNIGQLVREEHKDEGVMLVGFGSHRGSVIASRSWGDPMRKIDVPEARPGSWEDMLHRASPKNKLLLSTELAGYNEFDAHLGHRAIGVVYNPQFEQYGNYVPSLIPYRYDAFLFVDETQALHPFRLEPKSGETPETYPFAL